MEKKKIISLKLKVPAAKRNSFYQHLENCVKLSEKMKMVFEPWGLLIFSQVGEPSDLQGFRSYWGEYSNYFEKAPDLDNPIELVFANSKKAVEAWKYFPDGDITFQIDYQEGSSTVHLAKMFNDQLTIPLATAKSDTIIRIFRKDIEKLENRPGFTQIPINPIDHKKIIQLIRYMNDDDTLKVTLNDGGVWLSNKWEFKISSESYKTDYFYFKSRYFNQLKPNDGEIILRLYDTSVMLKESDGGIYMFPIDIMG
jgi:hypothetical protein